MAEWSPKILLLLGVVLGGLFALYRVVLVSASNAGYIYFAALIGGELLILALWEYRVRFFPVLILVFLLAGAAVPLHTVWTAARWGVLAAGAITGFALYVRSPVHRFGAFHLTALFALIAALVSALVSDYPKIAMLKGLSLLLVFLYGSAGARLAVAGREAEFCAGLLRACEILVYLSAFSYLVLRFSFYGNPNSLGVVMGVVAFPLLLWGVIASEGTRSYKHRLFALALCVVLLLMSYARAAIGAALISSLLLTLTLRRYRLLAKGAALALAAALLIATVSPLPEGHSDGGFTQRLSDKFMYKGKRAEGLMGSRQSPWQRTASIIGNHPWFGTGFGTSVTAFRKTEDDLSFNSVQASTREHGTSYLEILEWTGLLGTAPFYFLVFFVGIGVIRVVIWMRRTGSPFSPAVPIAAVLSGALFHAAFEDWMFAPGYYMCVFFWVFAFLLMDVLPVTNSAVKQVEPALPQRLNAWDPSCSETAPGR